MTKSIRLDEDNIFKLLSYFTIPSIIALIVNSLYNIVDQIFIGQYVGPLGNAATTVMFPFITISIAFSLVIGNGASAYYSLKLGQKNYKLAQKTVATSIILLFFTSIIIFTILSIYYKPLLILFGASDNILPYAIDYSRIIIFGLPLSIIVTGVTNIIRADGSPKFSMYSTLTGAIINTILDPIFINNLNLGIKGAAYATVLSQFIVFLINIYYIFFGFKYIKINFSILFNTLKNMRIYIVTKILSLGISSFFSQIAVTIVQIALNNLMKYYGSLSIYGSDIPIASMGIVMKVSSIMFSIIFGIAIGAQPILGFNYGAKKYNRVINTYKLEILLSSIISIIGCIFFVFFPNLIIPIFGKSNNPLYNEFLNMTFRIYLSATFIVGFQVCSSLFFPSDR